jgi:hypothetical protein
VLTPALPEPAGRGSHDVREGDIVVLSHPPLGHRWSLEGDPVKRVVALPTETIYSRATAST